MSNLVRQALPSCFLMPFNSKGASDREDKKTLYHSKEQYLCPKKLDVKQVSLEFSSRLELFSLSLHVVESIAIAYGGGKETCPLAATGHVSTGLGTEIRSGPQLDFTAGEHI